MKRVMDAPRRTLLRDVAERAGVSLTTVSMVLNGKAGSNIPPATKARVLAAAAELAYVPNAMARGLRRRRSDTIGVISDTIATTPFAGAMLQGAQDAAWRAEVVLLLVNTGGDPEIEERALAIMLARQVDAIVYARMYHQIVDPPASIRSVPSVLLDAQARDRSLPSVVPDEIGGAFDATEHLLMHGHVRVGYVQDEDPIPATKGRLEGYRRALAKHGIAFDPELVASAAPTVIGGVAGASRLMDVDRPPTALFCFNDRMAMGALRALRVRGLRAPYDVSVVGFDNEEQIAPWLDPPLTTVQLPHYEMGRWAAEQLLASGEAADASEGDGPPQHLMPCPLVERDSVGPVRSDVAG
jgi:LacI family transcriptional regulator